MADGTPERTDSQAHAALRRSSKRLLLLIENEIAHSGGGRVMLYNDQLAEVGSVNVVLPGLSELHALGLIDRLGQVFLSFRGDDLFKGKRNLATSARKQRSSSY